MQSIPVIRQSYLVLLACHSTLTINLNWWTLGFSASHSYIPDTSPDETDETLTVI